MDKLEKYRKIIEQILREYAAIPYRYGEVEEKVIIDREGNNFFLVDIGWQNKSRVHGFIVHVEIIGDKIWIQRDGLEDGITDELVAAGVPKDKIVLGFHPPEVRQYTGYAVS